MEHTLTAEILKLSVSDYWDTAKQEWSFEYAYKSDTPQTCLCGHFPIINICIIKNSENKNQTEVANCCINKFLGIERGNKIFTSIKRLKEDLSKSMSAEVLEYLRDKKVISGKEYSFYSDTIRKRILSPAQTAYRESINQKLLDFTSGETRSVMARIGLVLAWAAKRPSFDKTFIQSLKKQCESGGKLSEKQLQALEKVIANFRIV